MELLGYLVERTAEARILVLATYRTSGPDRSGSLGEAIAGLYRLDGVSRLDLRPLTADDIAGARWQLELGAALHKEAVGIMALGERNYANGEAACAKGF